MQKRNKKVNKIIAVFQIILLSFSLFAFMFIINSHTIHATDVWSISGGKVVKYSEEEASKLGLSKWYSEADATNALKSNGGGTPTFYEYGKDPASNPLITPTPTSVSSLSDVSKWKLPKEMKISFSDGSSKMVSEVLKDQEGYYTLGKNGERLAIQESQLTEAGVDPTKLEQIKTDTKSGGFLEGILNTPVIGGIIKSAGQAALLGTIGNLLGGLIGPENSNAGTAAQWGLVAGSLTLDWAMGTGIFSDKIGVPLLKSLSPEWGWTGGIISGLVVGFIVFAMLYKEYNTKQFSFECVPYQAPIGNAGKANCELCNNNPFRPCSEYRCKALGQACALVNAGTGAEACVWNHPHDVTSPEISPNYNILTEGYKYTNVRTRPPGWGMNIEKNDQECVKAFTALTFGITTNEATQCRIDYDRPVLGGGTQESNKSSREISKFDKLKYNFGSSLYLYNHSITLTLPGPKNIEQESPQLTNDGTYTLYTICRDVNGNENLDEFAIKFCVDKGPDTTPPEVIGTNIINGNPVKYNTSSVNLELYVNEPVSCKWSRSDRDYDTMEYNMTCASSVTEMNAIMLYVCKTKLDGLKNEVDNEYYFRCKDQPLAPENERNKMAQSYKYTLKGTRPLSIVKATPNNETIKDATNAVKVDLEIETFGGHNLGDATCYFNSGTADDGWIQFLETGTNKHSQRQDLPEGSYTYQIKCVDLGGNEDKETISFRVDIDNEAPEIARVFNYANDLKIITSEEADCVYDTKNCEFEFESGIAIPLDNSKEHTAEWNTETTYYVKCSDSYGNKPSPGACSIVIKMFEEK